MMTRRPLGDCTILTPTTSMMYHLFHPTHETSSNSSMNWTSEENKRFEELLAEFDGNTPQRWLKIAAKIPGKSPGDVEVHYNDLVNDVSKIEAGAHVFSCSSSSPSSCSSPPTSTLFGLDWENYNCVTFDVGKQAYRKRKSVEQERKKGVPWTEEEHRRFLLGLRKYGKGDWRSISREFVQTRTSTQVASHAQKYFLRLNSGSKDKRRSSIHDITTANLSDNNSPLSPSHPNSENSCDSSVFCAQFSTVNRNQQRETNNIFGCSYNGNALVQSQFESAEYRMN